MKTLIRRHIVDLLTHPEADARRHAAEELGRSGSLATTAALAVALRDSSKGVRDAAARSLQTIGGEETARLVAEYIADENIVTRNLAGSLLVQLGNTAVPAIVPYLRDVHHDVRKFAVDLLGLIGNRDAVASTIPLLEDLDANVVVSAVEALGNIGDPKALPDLLIAFHTHEYARPVILEAIGKLGDPSASPFLVSVFKQIVIDPNADQLFFFTLLEALSAVGDADALRILRQHVISLKGKLKRTLMYACIQIAERHHVVIETTQELKADLLELLYDDDPRLYENAVNVLSRYNDNDVTAAFIAKLGVSESLDSVLCKILCQRSKAFALAIETLTTCIGTNRGSIIRLFLAIVEDRSHPALRKLFEPGGGSLLEQACDAVQNSWNEADEETRSVIVDVLFQFDGARAVEFFGRVLHDADPWLRAHSIELLGNVTHGHVQNLLQEFVKDEDDMVRELAISMLARRGYPLRSIESSGEDPLYEKQRPVEKR